MLKNAQLMLTNEQENLSFVMKFIIKFSGKNGKKTWEVFFLFKSGSNEMDLHCF